MTKRYIFLAWILFIPLFIYGQADMIDGYKPRLLTRGKMWSAYRMNGLDGGGNRGESNSHSQESLTYPGNAARSGPDFVEYWMDVEAYINNEPNVVEVPRTTISQNSRGQGVWVLAITSANDTLVSYSGPRNVTDDVYPGNKTNLINALTENESSLGDTSGHNLVRSNYYGANINDAINSEPLEIHNYRYGEYIPNDEYPEEIIVSYWKTETGIHVTRKAFAWSYQDYDDFIIQELIFENTGSQGTLDSVYFSLANAFSTNAAAHHWATGGGMGWSDWRHNRLQTQDEICFYTKHPDYLADNQESTADFAQELMFYQRDGDWLSTNWDDTGQPYKWDVASQHPNEFQGQSEGQLLAYQYIGMGILDYTPEGFVHPQNVDQQPFAMQWWHNGNNQQFDYNDPNSQQHSPEEMYRMMLTRTDSSYMFIPEEEDLGTHALVFGPYHLAPGEKAKLVIAFVGGTGADWGERNMDELTWSLTNNAKLQLIDGEHSLFRNYRKAKFAYENRYDLPDPPPDVYTWFGNSIQGQVIVNWDDSADDAEDPDYSGEEAKDVIGYRVYRSWPPSHYWHYGPWELVSEFDKKDPRYFNEEKGIYTFVDGASFPGYNYYYNVRTIDSGHDHWYDKDGNDLGPIPSLESGYSSPEQKNMIAVTPFQTPIAAYDKMQEKIHIVPNPYRLDFSDPLHMYPDVADPYKLRIINLPRHCMIKVYSVSGDLVFEKEHQKESSAEDAWRQETITFSGHVVSGLYFWLVESLTEESYGEIQRGTLAIIK